jgi:Uri superfamily endonuclease
MRWHVDRLTRLAPPVGAIVWPWEPGRECALADALQKTGLGQIALDHFGASDCHCAGHLLKLRTLGLRLMAGRLSRFLDAGAGRVCSFPLTQHEGQRDAVPV